MKCNFLNIDKMHCKTPLIQGYHDNVYRNIAPRSVRFDRN